MPGYVIHLAVGKIYEKNNKIKNISSFRKGLIAPDMSDDSPKAHYGTSSSQPDLKRFLSENNDFDEYKEGYFLHLVTDYLFYNCFLKTWSPSIYEDYDRPSSSSAPPCPSSPGKAAEWPGIHSRS